MIDVARSAMRVFLPHREERRPLEHEGRGVRRRGQTVEKAFEHVAQEHLIGIRAGLVRASQQPLVHGHRNVRERPPAQASASM